MNPSRITQRVQATLRSAGLLTAVETLRFALSVHKYRASNREFVRLNPQFEVPPQALAYDAYSAPDWNFYKKSGEETAAWLAAMAKRHHLADAPIRVYEWGCGPARVLRHVPAAFGPRAEVFGSDYNPRSIEWCRKHIPGAQFELNALSPPLAYGDASFDFIYSISVFTHLSETVGRQWIAELGRVARPNAVLVISTNGESIRRFMLPEELTKYEHDGFLVRDNFEQGKKMFFACHSPKYLREILFKDFTVLEHSPAAFPHTGQDIWVIRKPG